jgi:pyrroloquinoline-quinone synthase
MSFSVDAYLEEIEAIINEKHLLKHPFYQAWSRGELIQSCLADYAVQYYQHVKAFPTYLSSLHSHVEEIETRKHLLQNLVDEEAGTPNHPDLWRDFIKGFGISDSEIESAIANQEIEDLIKNFREVCLNHSTAEGLAALYSYESQIPEVSISKIDGLRKFYDKKEPKDWQYFSIHIEADKEHAAVERELLKKYLNQSNIEDVKSSVNSTLDRLNDFLSGMCHKYNIACS